MEIIYRANDGSEFHDEDECREYEQLCDFEEKDYCTFANDTADIAIFSTLEIIKGDVRADDFSFILAPNKTAYYKNAELIEGYYCCSFPEWDDSKPDDVPQMWLWDESTSYGCWKPVDTYIEEYIRTMKIFNKMQKRD